MKSAALGFRVHSGWSALIALAVAKGSPTVLVRERIHLVETFTYRFRQPYHTAERMRGEEASKFISAAQVQARELAVLAIQRVQANLQLQGYEVNHCGLLLASGRPLPELDRILASHALIHTADGELFREAILYAGKRCGLEAFTVKERELLDSASQALRLKPAKLTRCIADLGRPLGAPWTQDEKFASLVAWMALSSHRSSMGKGEKQF